MITSVIIRFGNTYGEFQEYLIPLKSITASLYLALDNYVKDTKTHQLHDLVYYEALSPVPYNCIDAFSFYDRPVKLYAISSEYYSPCKIQEIPAYFITNSKRSKRVRISAGNLRKELIDWLTSYREMNSITNLNQFYDSFKNTILLLPKDIPGDILTDFTVNATTCGIGCETSDDLHFIRHIKGEYASVTVKWNSGTFIFDASLEDLYGAVLYAIYQQCVSVAVHDEASALSHDKYYNGVISALKSQAEVTVAGCSIDHPEIKRLSKYVTSITII